MTGPYRTVAPDRAGKRRALPDPAWKGVPVHSGVPGLSGRGHRPQPCAVPWPAGGHSPRPAPAPPLGRALRPRRVGRWPFVALGPADLQGTVAHGRGNAVRFLIPPGVEVALRRRHGRGHRPCHSAALSHVQPGAKAPGQRPPRPWAGRFSAAGSGAGLRCSWTCRSAGHRPAQAGDTQCVSCSRPETVQALSPLQWQGPSPLPQRHAVPRPTGAKAPGQRPPRPRRALLARRVGRWPALCGV